LITLDKGMLWWVLQAKLEEERRAAVAAREAARAHVMAMAQQREAVRQQQASLLRDKVNARLKQAAERR
jgi:anti-sigma factor RsiW